MVQEWIHAEEMAGRAPDMKRISDQIKTIMKRHNNTPRKDFRGLTPNEMHYIIYHPFCDKCVVGINTLNREQYEKIPLIRQTLFLLNKLGEQDLKLTKLGWLPLKIVNEAYLLGQPVWIIEEFHQKRINEYEAGPVMMARIIITMLGWVKKRKGMLSLTIKGKKALLDIDRAANEILRCALTDVALQNFDNNPDDKIGNIGIPYSVWLLNEFGSEWHYGRFYQSYYQMIFDYPDPYDVYSVRVFYRLFFWLGVVEIKRNNQSLSHFNFEYRKSELFPVVFNIKR